MSKQILVLPGDGIGPDIMAEAVKVLRRVDAMFGLGYELGFDSIGGAAYEQYGTPLSDQTLARARAADAILLGAVGGPKWETIDPALRPERGLLKIRSELGLFANLRPAILYPQLAGASALKPEVVAGLDILIVRELTGGRAGRTPWPMANATPSIRCPTVKAKSAALPKSGSRWRGCEAKNCARWIKPMS